MHALDEIVEQAMEEQAARDSGDVKRDRVKLLMRFCECLGDQALPPSLLLCLFYVRFCAIRVRKT